MHRCKALNSGKECPGYRYFPCPVSFYRKFSSRKFLKIFQKKIAYDFFNSRSGWKFSIAIVWKFFRKKFPDFFQNFFFKKWAAQLPGGSLELFLELLELLLGALAARCCLLRELFCLDLLRLVQLRQLFLTRWHTITLAFFLLKNITVPAVVDKSRG